MNNYDFLLRLLTLVLIFAASTVSFTFFLLWKKRLAYYFSGFILGLFCLFFGETISFLSVYIEGIWFNRGSFFMELISAPSGLLFTYCGVQIILTFYGRVIKNMWKLLLLTPLGLVTLLRFFNLIPEVINTLFIVLTSIFLLINLIVLLKNISDKLLKKSIQVLIVEFIITIPFIFLTLLDLFNDGKMRIVYLFSLVLAIQCLRFAYLFFSKKPVIVDGLLTDEFSSSYSLTKRESEIVSHIIQGKKNQEIADDLYISSRTVTTHLTNIYNKVGVKNRMQLMSLFSSNL